MKLRIRPEAWLDLEETERYLNDEIGSKRALEFYRLAKQTIKDISREPGKGQPRRDLKPPGIRSLRVAAPFENWLIFYQQAKGAIEILCVKDGAVDLPRAEL